MDCSQSALVAAAKCFRCHGHDERERVKIYLLCQLATVGVMANIVPPGSTYSGATPTFTLTVAPNTSYVIMWGANDLSMTMGGVTYNSTGLNTSTVVYTGANTQMVFTGTFAGTTVTVRVSAAPPAKVPIPSGFTAVLNAAGTSIVVGWDTPVLTFVNYTEVWTSNDNVTYSLATTVNFPTASTTVPAPSAGSTKYVKIRWCSNALAACGQFTSPLNAPNTVVANWATRVVANGGAAVSQSTISAADTFYAAISSFASLFKTLNIVAKDSVIAALTPLIVGSGADPWAVNGGSGTVGAGVVTVNGWQATGDTGTHWLAPVIILSNIASFSVSNGGMSIYCFTLLSEASNRAQAGVTDAAGRRFQFDLNDSSGPGSVAVMCNDFGTSNGGGAPGTSKGAGFYSMNRNAANALHCYFAKSSSAFADAFPNTTGTNVTTPPQTQGMVFAGYNNNGVVTASQSTYSFFALHDALTSAQAQTLYNAVQALRTALGGGFV